MKHFDLQVRNNSLYIRALTNKFMSLCNDYEQRLTTHKLTLNWRTKKYMKVIDKTYTAGNKRFKEFILHKSNMNDFFIFLKSKGVTSENVVMKDFKRFRPAKIDTRDKLLVEDREYQDQYHTALINRNDHPIKLVDLQTGKGKTIIALKAIKTMNYRTAVIVLGRYVEKWISDIKKSIYYTKGDILVVRGKDQLLNIMKKSKLDNFNPKFIIFSNKTLYNYFKTYETLYEKEQFQYPIKPANLFRELKIGTLLIDEIHQEYYSHYRAILLLDPLYTIALTATLITNDKELDARYKDMFPPEARLSFLDYHKYVTMIPYSYRFRSVKKMKHIGFNGSYSHDILEGSLIDNPHYLEGYLNMITHVAKTHYMDRRKKKEKMIIFAYTVGMCRLIRDHLRENIPNTNIRKYTAEDDYENIINSEIGVTTIGSAGTAIDIKGLITVLLTVNIESAQANVQVMGRLRHIENRETQFIYLYSKEIQKHVQYHYSKIKLLGPKILKLRKEEYHKTIG